MSHCVPRLRIYANALLARFLLILGGDCGILQWRLRDFAMAFAGFCNGVCGIFSRWSRKVSLDLRRCLPAHRRSGRSGFPLFVGWAWSRGPDTVRVAAWPSLLSVSVESDPALVERESVGAADLGAKCNFHVLLKSFRGAG